MKSLALIFLFLISISTIAKVGHQIDLTDFSKILILHEGRAKPIDTYSRLILREIYGRERFENLDSNQWLLETIFNPKESYNNKIFKINNPQALSSLGLDSQRKFYSFIEIYKAFSSNQEMLNSILQIATEDLDPNNQYIKDLYNRFTIYMGLSRSFSFLFKDFTINELPNYSYYDLKQIDNPNIPKTIQDYFTVYEEDSNLKSIYLFHSKANDLWLTPWEEVKTHPKNNPNLNTWNNIYKAYLENNKSEFNKNVQQLTKNDSSLKTEIELFQNKIYFSTWITTLYIISFALIFIYILLKKTFLIELSTLALYTGTVIHLFMIIFRSIILSRPPVSNLYESILFVSLTSVVVGVFYYLKTKNIMGIFLSSSIGVALLFLSQGYERSGDNMGMVVAVLDTNFWLATHVLTISIGYGCALVMSFMAHYYLIQYHSLSKQENEKIYNNIHLILLFSLFFTVLGTILGGIWADQSWGRFWGWDPKENGALLICLWLLWIAHAKISRHFDQIKYAIFVSATSIIVILAWFGVNLLNVGLHSYGFSNDTAYSIALFTLAEIIILTALYLRIRLTIKKA